MLAWNKGAITIGIGAGAALHTYDTSGHLQAWRKKQRHTSACSNAVFASFAKLIRLLGAAIVLSNICSKDVLLFCNARGDGLLLSVWIMTVEIVVVTLINLPSTVVN